MKRIASAAVVICGLTMLVSCQAVFTYSPFEFLERDIGTLSDEQQVEQARDILVAGTDAEVIEAYDAIAAIITAGDTTAETNLLAADLAFAASGVSEVIAEVFTDPTILATATADDITTLMESLDTDYLTAGATYVETASADSATEVSSAQYIAAATAMMVSAASEAGGFDFLDSSTPLTSGDPGYEEFTQAEAFLVAGGYSDFTALLSAGE